MNVNAMLTGSTSGQSGVARSNRSPASIGEASRSLAALVQSGPYDVDIGRSRWTSSEDSSPRSVGLSPRALHRALAFMEANLGKRLSLDAVAASAAVSRFHFARLFRVTTGYSPMAFLMRARIARGKDLLKRGDVSICEVAAALGFCDQSHFTRTFRRITGMSPRQFMRQSENVGAFN